MIIVDAKLMPCQCKNGPLFCDCNGNCGCRKGCRCYLCIVGILEADWNFRL